ncbi:MAG: PspC domain-containing protein [Ignavibacteria bacterium]|nr:PspC domain-containing protein [Ignavibacteria bacterium]
MENFEEQINPEEHRNSLEIIPSQKILMGVCSAFGNYINYNPNLVRLIVLLLFLLLGQPILLIYAAFGILLPHNDQKQIPSESISKKLVANIFLFVGLVLLLLMQMDVIKLKEVFEFAAERIDSFTLLVFSIALLINGFQKEKLEMNQQNEKTLKLSDKKLIFGVCGGLAEYLNINPTIMRIIWIIFGITSLGVAIIIYIILRFIIPSKNSY